MHGQYLPVGFESVGCSQSPSGTPRGRAADTATNWPSGITAAAATGAAPAIPWSGCSRLGTHAVIDATFGTDWVAEASYAMICPACRVVVDLMDLVVDVVRGCGAGSGRTTSPHR